MAEGFTTLPHASSYRFVRFSVQTTPLCTLAYGSGSFTLAGDLYSWDVVTNVCLLILAGRMRAIASAEPMWSGVAQGAITHETFYKMGIH